MMKPTLITPAAAPVVTLAEAKLHLRVLHNDDNDYIEQLVESATSYVETLQNRALVNQVWQQATDAFVPDIVRLHLSPVSGVTVKYSDIANVEQTLALANYFVGSDDQSAFVQWLGTLPLVYAREDAIRVNFTAGYGADGTAVPAVTYHAILKYVGQFYLEREPVNSEFGQLWQDADRLLRSKRRMAV